MANQDHVTIVKRGAVAIREWREQHKEGMDLRHASLEGANLGYADLAAANLQHANLEGTIR